MHARMQSLTYSYFVAKVTSKRQRNVLSQIKSDSSSSKNGAGNTNDENSGVFSLIRMR